jgi:sarcosine oxidase subunit beta
MSDRAWDAIVVGAGSVGVPVALALGEHRLRVLVLDKEPSVGQGQNKAAIGGVRATHSDPAKIAVCLDSVRLLSRWEERTGHDVGWQTGGYCYPAYREEDETTLKGLLKQQHACGLNINWLVPDVLRKLVPDINPEGLRGGTFSPDDGNCSPLLLITSYYRLAKDRGVSFRFGETVSEIVRNPAGRVSGVRASSGTYFSDSVVVAAGADANALLAPLGVPVPVEPDSHEGGITEPVRPFLGPLMVDVRPGTGSRNAYFYQNHLGRILFCVTPEPLVPGTNRACTSRFLPTAARRLLDLIPRLRYLRVRRTWRGLYPMTPDGAPIVDRVPEVPGLVIAIGMCGQGFMIAPGLARHVVSLVLTGETELPAEVASLWKLERSYDIQEILR